MTETYEVILFILCLLLSGFYSGAEAALISISVDRAKQMLEEEGSKARALEFLIHQPTTVLTTILVGNNLVNVLAASLVTVIAQRYFQNEAVAISTGLTTFLILIFGEITPKTLARKHAENWCYFIIRVLQFNYIVLFIIIWPITFFIRKLLGENAELSGRLVTSNDIEFMVNKAEKEKSMDSKQLDMLSSILEFPTIKVKDIMVPRLDVRILKKSQSFREVIYSIRQHGHSRYPVVKNDLDDCLGFMHVKDLAFVKPGDVDEFNISKWLKPPFFIYEHMRVQAVFEHMKKKKVHLALVKDENGLVVGIITLEDIIEEIVGEIQDEHDNEEEHDESQKITDGVSLEGATNLRDLYNDYDIKIPLNDNYSTLAGFLLDMLGNNFPEEGQMIFWEGYSFKLVQVKNQEIQEVKVQQVDGEHIVEENQTDQ